MFCNTKATIQNAALWIHIPQSLATASHKNKNKNYRRCEDNRSKCTLGGFNIIISLGQVNWIITTRENKICKVEFLTVHWNLQLNNRDHSIFLVVHGTFIEMNQMLGYSGSAKEILKVKIMSTAFTDHRAMKLAINDALVKQILLEI